MRRLWPFLCLAVHGCQCVDLPPYVFQCEGTACVDGGGGGGSAGGGGGGNGGGGGSAGGSPMPDAGPLRVFLSSEAHVGAFPPADGGTSPDGRAGADAFCKRLADASPLPGLAGRTWVAWLSWGLSSANARDRLPFDQTGALLYPYALVTGTPVFPAGFSFDLLRPDGGRSMPATPINVTEAGGTLAPQVVWTGTLNDGTVSPSPSHFCKGWNATPVLTADGGPDSLWLGFLGDSSNPAQWSASSNFGVGPCSDQHRLYCFEAAPGLSVTPAAAPARDASHPKLNPFDPGAPADAWKRDETVVVRLDCPVALGVASLSAQAPLRDGGVSAPMAIGPAADQACCGGARPNCRCFSADLGQLPFEAFRGAVSFKGTSKVCGDGEARIPVTRWRWAHATFAAGDAVRTPVTDPMGRVYLGASATPRTGALMAVAPNGSALWQVPWGGVDEGLVLSADAGVVYVPTFDDDGGTLTPALQTTGAPLAPGCAASDSDLKIVPTAAFAGNTEVVVTLRANDGGFHAVAQELAACFTKNDVRPADSAPRANSVSTDTHFFFGNKQAQQLESAPLATLAALPPVPFDFVPAQLALVAEGVIATGSKGMRLVPYTGDGGWTNVDFGGQGAAVADGSHHLYGSAGPVLFKLGFDAATSTLLAQTTLDDEVAGSPVLGAPSPFGRELYAAARSGRLSSFDVTGLEKQWDVALTDAGIAVSPAIDCGRRPDGGPHAGPGTLYVVAKGSPARLIAIIVDAPGLDFAAAWPKHQHDPRNSGNANGARPEYRCGP